MGVELPRREMLRLALMASENRAASALARHYPGGSDAFVAAMNAKAASLGMTRSHFDDSTGLSPSNVSTARDLAKMVEAASGYPLIREFSVTPSHFVEVQPDRPRRSDSTTRTGWCSRPNGTSSSRRPATSARRAAAS